MSGLAGIVGAAVAAAGIVVVMYRVVPPAWQRADLQRVLWLVTAGLAGLVFVPLMVLAALGGEAREGYIYVLGVGLALAVVTGVAQSVVEVSEERALADVTVARGGPLHSRRWAAWVVALISATVPAGVFGIAL